MSAGFRLLGSSRVSGTRVGSPAAPLKLGGNRRVARGGRSSSTSNIPRRGRDGRRQAPLPRLPNILAAIVITSTWGPNGVVENPVLARSPCCDRAPMVFGPLRARLQIHRHRHLGGLRKGL